MSLWQCFFRVFTCLSCVFRVFRVYLCVTCCDLYVTIRLSERAREKARSNTKQRPLACTIKKKRRNKIRNHWLWLVRCSLLPTCYFHRPCTLVIPHKFRDAQGIRPDRRLLGHSRCARTRLVRDLYAVFLRCPSYSRSHSGGDSVYSLSFPPPPPPPPTHTHTHTHAHISWDLDPRH